MTTAIPTNTIALVVLMAFGVIVGPLSRDFISQTVAKS
jgi:hypothetical protein